MPVKLRHLKTSCSEFKEKEIHIHFERVCDELFKAKKKKKILFVTAFQTPNEKVSEVSYRVGYHIVLAREMHTKA